ncbi:MAG TPA: universal stress protein [Syntrophomonadaceae bacterium]|nr:universal stress protein [Syntrophomonadaceae bacterium]HPR93896.1 universal stress protein [Syntrophomonadaceae bacterium]
MGSSFFNRVLIAVDDSDQSTRAVDMAVRMAESSIISSAVLFNVYDSGSVDVTKLHSAEKLDKLKAASLALLQEYEKSFTSKGISCQVKSAGGEPSQLILDLIEDSGDFDLIIIGSRKLNKFQEITLRSVSDKVTRLVNVPVLIIK